jgi:hypothetical protein
MVVNVSLHIHLSLDDVAEKIRQVGGIQEIVKLHKLPFLKLDHTFARVLLFVDLHLTKSGRFFLLSSDRF